MSPPSRTISAARRISRSCGFSGCSSKYWLTGVSSGARHSAACCRYHTRPFRPAAEIPALTMQTFSNSHPGSSSASSTSSAAASIRPPPRSWSAMALLLAYDWLRTRKVPQMHLALSRDGAGVRRGHADPSRRAVPAVESLGVLLAARPAYSSAAVWIGKKTLLERVIGAACRRTCTVPPAYLAQRIAADRRVLRAARRRQHLGGARTRSEADWVIFKVWIALPAGHRRSSLGVVLYLLRGVFTQARRNQRRERELARRTSACGARSRAAPEPARDSR